MNSIEESSKQQSSKNTHKPCPVCSSSNTKEIIALPQVPVLSNVLWDRREDALAAPRGDVQLVFCQTCGHVFNQAFDPARMEYDVQYENSLHFSPTFQNYATRLAHHLIDQYDLHGKKMIEIGSGKGEFLRMLCEFGGNTATGFDPSYEPGPEDGYPGISFVKDLYSKQYSGYQADLILSRHVLEHIYQPAEFVQSLRSTIGDRTETVVFCEVPNLGYILRDTAIWDIIYEHYSYFSARSLAEIFTRHGFRVLNLEEAFHGQFVYVEAVPQEAGQTTDRLINGHPVEVLADHVAGFASRSQAKLARWNEQLTALYNRGKRAVLWGAGSKGISFLNMVPAAKQIEVIVDINPRKRGRYVTGAGQQIVPPDFLASYRPDTIIVMNPVYQPEIQALIEPMGLQMEFLTAL